MLQEREFYADAVALMLDGTFTGLAVIPMTVDSEGNESACDSWESHFADHWSVVGATFEGDELVSSYTLVDCPTEADAVLVHCQWIAASRGKLIDVTAHFRGDSE